MKRAFALPILLVLALALDPSYVRADDVVTDSHRLERQAALIPSLQQAASRAGGYDSSSVKVRSTAHQITVDVLNSKLNGASAADRSAEASAIASAVQKAIDGKPEFAAVREPFTSTTWPDRGAKQSLCRDWFSTRVRTAPSKTHGS